jgi:uncharacterized iron-regulated protein
MRQHKFLAALLLLAVAACAYLGIQPETTKQNLAVLYSTVTEVRKTSTTLLQAKKISADDHQNIEQQADNARAGIEIARTLAKTDPKAADAKLASVRASLAALESYLATKK